MRAGRVYIRRSAGAVTRLERPTGISAAHMPCTASLAAREGWRGNRQYRYDRCGNCCSREDRTHSCRSPSSRATIGSKHQSLRLRSVRRRPHSSRPRGDIASLRLPAVKDCSNPGDLQWGQLNARGPLPPERHTDCLWCRLSANTHITSAIKQHKRCVFWPYW